MGAVTKTAGAYGAKKTGSMAGAAIPSCREDWTALGVPPSQTNDRDDGQDGKGHVAAASCRRSNARGGRMPPLLPPALTYFRKKVYKLGFQLEI